MEKYIGLATSIIENIGGEENIQSVGHCITRLRFVLKDNKKANTEAIQKLEGVINVLQAGGQYQVVIGTHVPEVFKAIQSVRGLEDDAVVNIDASQETKKKGVSLILDTISSIFLPIASAMAAAGILKGLLVLFTALGWMSETSGTYAVLYAAGDAFFYFLPLALAITASRKFGANNFVALAVVGPLLYPNLVAMYNAGTEITFMGLPVQFMDYGTSVIPAIFAIYILSKLEKLLKRYIPEVVKGIFVPLLSLVIMVPITLILIGPLSGIIGNFVANGYTFLYDLFPPLAGLVLATLWPILVIFGAHWALVPIVMNNFAVYGYDTLLPVSIGTNFAMAGAALAVCLKTKDLNLKQLAGSSSFAALIGGVTEPAIYGVNLKFKKPFIISCICIGIGGIIVAIAGGQYPSMLSTCLLTLPAIAIQNGGVAMVIASVIGFVGAFIGTYLFGFNDDMLNK